MTSNIFGIGYEGVTLDEFIQTLKNREATILVDVRLNPISRKKGFPRQSFLKLLASMVSGMCICVS